MAGEAQSSLAQRVFDRLFEAGERHGIVSNDKSASKSTVEILVRPKWTYVVPTVAVDYWRHVMADVPAGLYGRDQTRAELHAALCEHYGLTREQTQDVTDHMDRLDHPDGGGSTALHKALQDLWDKYPLANAGLHLTSEAQHNKKGLTA